MFNKETLYFLGTLLKTHGMEGGFIMALNNIHSEDLPDIQSVFIEIEGLLVPFFISDIKDMSETSVLIRFDDIDSKAKAKEFIGCNIYIPAVKVILSDDSYLFYHDFIGYEIDDRKLGKIGKITDILDIRDNPLFKVRYGKNEYMIPANKDFIKETDHKNKVIFTDIPDGLLNI
jgi:16S rRNA processing protein RimM